MASRAIWRRALFALVSSLMLGRVHAADPVPTPSDELLEYLGTIEETDQDLTEFVAAAAADHQDSARTEAGSAAKVKAEK